MPAALPALIGLGAAKFAVSAFAVKAFTAAAIGMAAAFITSGIIASSQKRPEFAIGPQSRREMIRSPDPIRDYVYGQVEKSGPVLFHHTTADNDFFYFVVALASHSVAGVDAIWFGENRVVLEADADFTTTGISHYQAKGHYEDVAWVDISLGSASNAANKRFTTELPGVFSSTDKFNGIAALYIKLKWSDSIWRSGIPQVRVRMRGKDTILDTRDATSSYKTNSALCILDYLKDSLIGLNVQTIEYDDTAFDTAANECDEAVTITEQLVPKEPWFVRAASTLNDEPQSAAEFVLNSSLKDRWISHDNSDEWIQIEYLSAVKLNRIVLTAPDHPEFKAEEMPTAFTLKASATGAYAGEEVTLSTQSGLTWSLGQQRTFNFVNASSYKYYRITPTANNGRLNYSIARWQSFSSVTSENRYELNGVILSSNRISDNLNAMLSSCAGSIVYVNGKFRLLAGAYQTPAITLTSNDILNHIVWKLPGRRDKFNAVRGKYISQINNFTVADFPVLTNSTYQTEDGERIFKDIDLGFTISEAAAQRIGKIELERNRQSLTVHSLITSLRKWDVFAGDTIMLTYADLGWSAKVFDVLSRSLVLHQPEGSDTPAFALEFVLRETASAVYTWSTEETTVDLAPNTNLANPFSTPDRLSSLILASDDDQLIAAKNGAFISRIRATWRAMTDKFITVGGRIEVQYKKSASAKWLPAGVGFVPGDETEAFIAEVVDGVNYDVRVRAVNINRVPGPWTTATAHKVIGKSAPPGDVLAFSASQNGEVVNFVWRPVDDVDLAGYEIRYGASNAVLWKDAFPLLKTARGSTHSSAKVPPGTYTFLVRAIDSTGNLSKNTSRSTATIRNLANVVSEIHETDLSTGTRTNFIKHWSGALIPDSKQQAQNLSDTQLWDVFVTDPYDDCYYETTVQDITFDDTVRVWANVEAELGGGETSGVASPEFQLFARGDGDPLAAPTTVFNEVSKTGTFVNCILHWSGAIIPDSQTTAASATDAQLWDEYVYNPYQTGSYEAPVRNLGGDYTFVLTPRMTEAIVDVDTTFNFKYLINYKSSTGTYLDAYAEWSEGQLVNVQYIKQKITFVNPPGPTIVRSLQAEVNGYNAWTNIGDLTARYFQGRIYLDTTKGVGLIRKLDFVIDLHDDVVRKRAVAIGSGGTSLLYSSGTTSSGSTKSTFHSIPITSATPIGTSSLTAVITNQTTTGFDVRVFYDAGVGVAATIDWSAEGA